MHGRGKVEVDNGHKNIENSVRKEQGIEGVSKGKFKEQRRD